jgi:hypothetical protein
MKLSLANVRTALLAAITLCGGLVFATPQPGAPIATSSSASGISPFAATLNGLVNPYGLATTAWFQWGADTNYGHLTASTNLSATWGNFAVSAAVSNLTPGQTWHFRVVASNSLGVATGSDMALVTPFLFTNLNAGLPEMMEGQAFSGDYDNDGRLDILLTGWLKSGSPADPNYVTSSLLYHNNGDGTFSLDANAGLTGFYDASVAWGDYDNDGRLDILLAGSTYDSSAISLVYHNDGGGVFTLNTNAVLQGVWRGSVAWGDYNNDGRLDILLTGGTDNQDTNGNYIYVSQVYDNNGDGSFTLNTNVVLPGVAYGSVAWGDYDNDGWLDILLTGQTGVDTNDNPIVISQVYHNNGDGTFTLDTNAVLPGVYTSSVAWGDYDNDGRLDILLAGDTGTTNENGDEVYISQVYHNNGDGSFTLDTNADMPGVYNGCVAWGDYDNDGRLDILLTGITGMTDTNGDSIIISSVYHNDGNGVFSLNTNAGLPGVYGSAAWGDYENDGRLDILLAGGTAAQDQYGYEVEVSGVYRNLSPVTNTPPTAPTGLTASVSDHLVSLAWAAATDAQTPAAGLTYNLRIGSTPGGSDLLSPESDTANGFRLLAQMGNSQLGTNAIVNISRFPAGTTCYWSVQAVDSAWAGSPFAAEGSFETPGRPEAFTLPASAITATQATLQGSVNQNCLPTLAWFQWGPTTNYGNLPPPPSSPPPTPAWPSAPCSAT